MITSLQKDQISNLLDGRNLPLDLKVEISDHIYEQLDFKIERESKDFSQAFIEVKSEWEKDLETKFSYLTFEKQTKIENYTFNKTNVHILIKTAIYFVLFVSLTLTSALYSKNLGSIFSYFFYLSLTLIYLMVLIKNYKILLSLTILGMIKVSYLKRGAMFFTLISIFIPLYLLFNFDNVYNSFYIFLIDLLFNGKFSLTYFVSSINFIMYAFAWIYGFLYFLEYKKAIKLLEQKINFKL